MPEAHTQHDPAWTDSDLADPHGKRDKAARVQRMFAAIARSYDLNNRLHSLGRDQAWRRKAVRMAEIKPGDAVLDVACGTGDLAMAFANKLWAIAKAGEPPRPGQVIGIDFTYEMLPIAQVKAQRAHAPAGSHTKQTTLADTIRYSAGDALHLPLPDASVDVLSIAFGIRNVTDPAAAAREFYRVLRPGGRVIVLEFSHPTNPVVRWCDSLYREKIMPRTATWIARDRSGAYRYLPQSVNTFLDRTQMTDLLTTAGFTDVTHKPLTFGIAVCYRGIRP